MRTNALRLIKGTRISPISLPDGILRHLERLAARGARPNTINAYRSDLMQFAEYVEHRHDGVLLVAVVAPSDVSGWLDSLDAAGIGKRSQARKLTVLRGFFRVAMREGWIGIDPTAEERVRFRTHRVIAPELPALLEMVNAIPDKGRLNLRDRALLRLALDTGIRISEAAALNIAGCGAQSEIDPSRKLVHVVGKGGDTETICYNDRTARILDDWLRVRPNMAAPGETALFVSQQGTRCTRQTLHKIVKIRASAAGLSAMHWHMFRHRRIRGIVEVLGTKIAQQFARHASEATTAIYGAHASSVTHALVREHTDLDRLANAELGARYQVQPRREAGSAAPNC